MNQKEKQAMSQATGMPGMVTEKFALRSPLSKKRDSLIKSLERRLSQKTVSEQLFILEWSVV